jgi:hypothetical protein
MRKLLKSINRCHESFPHVAVVRSTRRLWGATVSIIGNELVLPERRRLPAPEDSRSLPPLLLSNRSAEISLYGRRLSSLPMLTERKLRLPNRPTAISFVKMAIALILLVATAVPAGATDEAPATPTAGVKRPKIPNTLQGRQCTKQCEVFRSQCTRLCQRSGQVPGNMSRSIDCSKDCEEFESGCLRMCLGRVSRIQTKPSDARRRDTLSTPADIASVFLPGAPTTRPQ